MLISFLSSIIIPLIHLSAVAAAACFFLALKSANTIHRKIDRMSDKDFKSTMYYYLSIPYTIFTALISIFPLLGMLGTVVALLTLDLSGDTETVKSSFFQALDTTMWGLVYAIIFKIVNAVKQSFIETQEEKARQLLEKKYF